MKLIIFIVILYLAYRAFKYRISTNVISGSKTSTDPEKQMDSIMVKDPVCEVYFPQKNGIPLNIHGKTLYFCSENCKDTYLAQKADLK
jgi:uncharacterized protein